MGIEIHIEPKSREPVRGKPMPVPITLVLDEPLKVRGVHATFLGAEETKANYTTYNAATKTAQVHTATELVEIVRREFILSGNQRLGAFANLADGLATLFGGGTHESLQPGAYPFEVEIETPPHARGVLTGKKCRVFYELSVHVDVPMAPDAKATCSFYLTGLPQPPVLSGLVRTRYPEDQGKGLLDSWFGPDLRVEAALSESVFQRGDMIEGVFRVDAPEPLACRTIAARLVGVERTEAHGHHDTHTHHEPATVVATPTAIERSHKQDFRLAAAFQGPPTAQGRKFSIDWYVQIELDVPWAKDPKIRVPVTLLPD